MSKKIKESMIAVYKLLLYFLLFSIFFQIFKTRNIGLIYVSRTMVVTKLTFLVVGTLMLIVYGNFKIGEEKSKPIIYSMMLTLFITDIVTYLQLMIMNTNPANNLTFRLQQLDLLFFVFLIQMVVVVAFTYFGNYLYFKLYSPQKTVIYYDQDEKKLNNVLRQLKSYSLQYEIDQVVSLQDRDFSPEDVKNTDYVMILDIPETKRDEIVKCCYRYDRGFSFVPNLSDVIETGAEYIVFDDMPLLHNDLKGLSVEQKLIKRVIDIVLSLTGIIITSPVWLVIAIAIKLEDGGKVFFTQDRYTQNHRVFKLYKFRSMVENAHNYSAVEGDDRITKVGRVIRKLRVDELPQLLNILKGDMSLVGPRPEMLENVHAYEAKLPEFKYRLKVKAGLTGYAQIEGKYNTSPEDKLKMDLLYIENFSILTDIKIIFRTLIVFFKSDSTEGFGAHED